jgi:plastocyanin
MLFARAHTTARECAIDIWLSPLKSAADTGLESFVAARELRVVVAFAAAAVVAPGVIASHATGTGLQGVVRAAGRAARDVVIWVDAPGGTAPHTKAKLDQRNMQFVPRVLAVRVGTSVEMPNSDRLLHNVFSFHDGKIFDLGLYPVGASQTVKFDQPGLSRIFCNIHPTMAAYVLAVDSDYFAVSDTQGRFTIASVPGGTHTYHAWRAGKAVTTGTLVADPGRPVEVELP